MHRLPPEILSEVFLRCRDPPTGPLNCKPQLVTMVCGRWRQIALSTPALWRDIRIQREGPGAHEMSPGPLYALLELQLQRSCDIPLRVTLSSSYPADDEEFIPPESWQTNVPPVLDDSAVFRLLLTTTPRWEYLDLDITREQSKHLRTSGCEFPMLKRLTVRNVPLLDLGNLANSHLSELALNLMGRRLPKEMLPWQALVKCSLSKSSSSDALNLLATTPTLEEFAFISGYCLVEGLPRSASTTSTIKNLAIRRCSPGGVQDFLQNLCVPSLKTLQFDTVDNRNLSSLLSDLLSSTPSMTSLILTKTRLSEMDLIGLLPLLGPITHLSINWPAEVHTRALIGALTFTGIKATNWLPNLTHLTLTGGLSCADADLLRMLHSRQGTLRRVELFYAGRTFFFDRSLDRLRRGRGRYPDARLEHDDHEGMEIVVSFEDPLKSKPHWDATDYDDF
ncbi:F-box domain-containing protein [Mycena chlorophos]|uniref:F-box domain-containing protein n=1 Tax=Mycena chlorophos TaxID=658473 RepID=A0A8H6RZR9_MYCCL|nr:F-box domain-containing protein [Mycena chlorophos]